MTETPELTDAEQLAAIETYMKTLSGIATELRKKVTQNLGALHVERIGAYFPGGPKLATIVHSDGRKSAKVTDEAAAMAWCLKNYPGEVVTVSMIRPAFLKMLLDISKSEPVGDGVDPKTGEPLPFIQVTQGDPYVSVTATDEGVHRMEALAFNFNRMLDAPQV